MGTRVPVVLPKRIRNSNRGLCAAAARSQQFPSCGTAIRYSLGSFARRSFLCSWPLLGFGHEVELPTVSRGIADLGESVAPCIDVDGRRFSANLDEEAQKNEGNGTYAQPNTTHRLNRMDCVSQEHGKSPNVWVANPLSVR